MKILSEREKPEQVKLLRLKKILPTNKKLMLKPPLKRKLTMTLKLRQIMITKSKIHGLDFFTKLMVPEPKEELIKLLLE